MKTLLISTYDMEVNFQAKVLIDGKDIENYEESKELIKYDLYDFKNKWFSESLITENNDKIKNFDNIIVCEDGNIDIYLKGVSY